MVFSNKVFLVCAALLLVSGVAQAQRSGGGSPPHMPRVVAQQGGAVPSEATFGFITQCLRAAGPQPFCSAPSFRSLSALVRRTNSPHCNSADVLMRNNGALLEAVTAQLAQETVCGNALPSHFIPAAAPNAPAAPVARPAAPVVDLAREQRRLERQRRAVEDRQRTIQEVCASESSPEMVAACRACAQHQDRTWLRVSEARREGFERALAASADPSDRSQPSEARFRCVLRSDVAMHRMIGSLFTQQQTSSAGGGGEGGEAANTALYAVSVLAQHVQLAQARSRVESARVELTQCQARPRQSCTSEAAAYEDARSVLASLLEGGEIPDFDELALGLALQRRACAGGPVNASACAQAREGLRRIMTRGSSVEASPPVDRAASE